METEKEEQIRIETEIVRQFSKKMLDKIALRRNRYVPFAWKTMDIKRLLSLLMGELEELEQAYLDGDKHNVQLEAVDVANYAMFIHEMAEHLTELGED